MVNREARTPSDNSIDLVINDSRSRGKGEMGSFQPINRIGIG